jgi:hypothetical protein
MIDLNVSPSKSLTKLFLGVALVLAVGAAAPKVSQAAQSHDGVSNVEEAQPYDVKTEVVGDCKVGAECIAKITISAKGEFHVNESYPFKFTAVHPTAEFHGTGGNVFSAGDFERQGKTVGVMTVKFKPKDKGPTTITGKYKICICSDKICSPQVIDVSIAVNAK